MSKREGDSSLMQLKEEFRTYEALRREHDAQIVQIATEAGLRIAPDQWSSLLYGDTAHKSHMQSIIDKLQTPQSFGQSVQVRLLFTSCSGSKICYMMSFLYCTVFSPLLIILFPGVNVLLQAKILHIYVFTLCYRSW